MNITQIFSSESEVSTYLLGNKREHRTVILSSGEERFVLPVTPWRYQYQTAQENKTYDILDTGEVLVFGNSKLTRLKFSCFFPATKHKYPFVVGDTKETDECVALITKWRTSKSPVRVIITDSPINLQMAIMTADFYEKDGSRDIYYNLEFTEYRDFNTRQSNAIQTVDSLSGLRDRPNADRTLSEVTNFVGKTQDILEACKAAQGTFENLPLIMTANNITSVSPRSFEISKFIGLKW